MPNKSLEILKETWPEWSIVSTIGGGTYGKVYKAKRTVNGHEFESAIKIVIIPGSEEERQEILSYALTEEDTSKFLKSQVDDADREILLMESLKGNSHVVSIEDHKIILNAETQTYYLFIRMELLIPFAEVDNANTMSVEQKVKLGTDICTALEDCQRHGIIHRDIKPDNIFLSRDKAYYKLGDFGIGRVLSTGQTATMRRGTPLYIAPEVYKCSSYDQTADIYSLGMVLYTLFNNGRAPLTPNKPLLTSKDLNEAFVKRLSGADLPAPPNAPAEIADVILTACKYDPKQRFQTPVEMRSALIEAVNPEQTRLKREREEIERNAKLLEEEKRRLRAEKEEAERRKKEAEEKLKEQESRRVEEEQRKSESEKEALQREERRRAKEQYETQRRARKNTSASYSGNVRTDASQQQAQPAYPGFNPLYSEYYQRIPNWDNVNPYLARLTDMGRHIARTKGLYPENDDEYRELLTIISRTMNEQSSETSHAAPVRQKRSTKSPMRFITNALLTIIAILLILTYLAYNNNASRDKAKDIIQTITTTSDVSELSISDPASPAIDDDACALLSTCLIYCVDC